MSEEIKSKEEIFENILPDWNNYLTESGYKKMMAAMDSYSEIKAQGFAEWIALNCKWSEKYGWLLRTERNYETRTTSELYKLFIIESKTK